MQLSPEQHQIIQHDSGHAKVIAVAGAGKTTTLALFIQRRLQLGQNPRRMLVIMYNKSAQLDFTKKLQDLVQSSHSPSSLPSVRTFHALGLKIYQSLISDGILNQFQEDLISPHEQEYILWRLLQQYANKQTAQEILQDKKKWLDPMMSFLENVKSSLEPAELVFKESGLPKHCAFFAKVFDAYEVWRKQNRRIGFSDMLYDPCMLFSARPDVAARFGNHMDWVLVDEYQDINPIQQFLLQTLAGSRAQVMVIGDPDQTIYEFRGSSAQFMLKYFDEYFENVTRYTLSQTFRYGHDVAMLSNQLIQQNKQRVDVMCVAGDENADSQVTLYKHVDYAQKTIIVIKKALLEKPAQDIAVLFRLWGMSAPLELALLQEDIPYQMSHQSWVLQRMELQPLMMLLEMAGGDFTQRNERSRYKVWLTFLTFPALKIKRADLQVVAKELSMYSAESESGEVMPKFSQLSLPELSKWQSEQLENRLSLVTLAVNKRMMGYQLANCYIRETDFYKGISDSAFSKQQVDDRLATVQGFVRFIARLNLSAAKTHDYLQKLADKRSSQSNKQGIVLSSIHRAKGLQWPVVILPGLTNHYYPYQSDGEMQTASSIESERRLFYVAMTRCIEQLHLIAPSDDPTQGSPLAASQEISEFIHHMAVDDLLKVKKARVQGDTSVQLSRRVIKSVQRYLEKMQWSINIQAKVLEKPSIDLSKTPQLKDKLKKASNTEYRPIELVEHTKFGKGQIKDETERHWHVIFDDGQLRVLDKEIASTMLRWV